MIQKILILLALCISLQGFSQQRKTITASRVETPPKIDGILTDEVWQNLPAYGDFYMFEPDNNGRKERPTHKTEVKLAYDDDALYVAAYLYDEEPNKILRQFSQLDNIFVQADFFAITLNTYNDGINETRFFVTSAGTIGDARAEGNNEDFSYNVVFNCHVSFDEKGWYAEFRIPYNALRFPKNEEQNWSINFFRKIMHLNETYVWNYVDRKVGQVTQYNGLVQGIQNINPPLRLMLFPFVQGALTQQDGETKNQLTAGMDIKYGLSDSFTLDATLVPDFGQAAFDNVVLNLGPFEQEFSENRQFFTEGIELFNKGGLFYSRRIGGAPSKRYEVEDLLNPNEEIIENPEKVGLLNAVKVSGRTGGNLGIGFFNAITKKTEATIRDSLTGEKRTLITEPIANYNIVTLDQQFNKNSSVTLINTNVTRGSGFRNANVTGILYNISTPSNAHNFSGGIRISQLKEGEKTNGVRTNFEVTRTMGKFRWAVGHYFADEKYNSNDMGILFRNNFNEFFSEISYQIFEPTKKFNEYRIGLWVNHNRLYKPDAVTGTSVGAESFFITPSRFAFGGNIRYNSKFNDYFEPRVEGKFVTFSSNIGGNIWVSSDYRKKFAYDIGIGSRVWSTDPQHNLFIDISPRYRFSDKFLLIWSSQLSKRIKNFGYIDNNEEDVFLGQRTITNIENSLQTSYNFDPYKSINIRFRNFWSTANYKDQLFFRLNDDGTHTPANYDVSANNPNINYNIWNLDLSFNWRFAPGSEAILLYRNQVFNEDEKAHLTYTKSLDNLFHQPIQHTLSLRIVYFLDVNNLKNSF